MPSQRDVQWRTISRCPVCTGLVHLTRDPQLARAPRARFDHHRDGWGWDCYMSHRAAPAWDETTTRAAVWGRSMGVCEYCQAEQATDMHHRQGRGVGGKWHPANIIHLCRTCHGRCTSPAGENREWAEYVGLIVSSYEDPAKVVVLRGLRDMTARRVGHHTSNSCIEVLQLTDEVTGGLDDPFRPTSTDTRTKRRR